MNLVHKLHRRLKINRAVRELSQLSDHILLDIGIPRGNINLMVEKSITTADTEVAASTPSAYDTITDTFHAPSGAPA